MSQLHFQSVVKLLHAAAQALVLARQGIAIENASNAGVAFGKSQQQVKDFSELGFCLLLFAANQRDATENSLFYKLNQAFKHLRLAGEVAV